MNMYTKTHPLRATAPKVSRKKLVLDNFWHQKWTNLAKIHIYTNFHKIRSPSLDNIQKFQFFRETLGERIVAQRGCVFGHVFIGQFYLIVICRICIFFFCYQFWTPCIAWEYVWVINNILFSFYFYLM